MCISSFVRVLSAKRFGTEVKMLYHNLYITILVILAVMLFPCLIRAVKGPRIADRLVSVNMMGIMVMVMIAILALMLDEGYLADICLIYAMISFLAVIVLVKVYMGVYLEGKEKGQKDDGSIVNKTETGEDS